MKKVIFSMFSLCLTFISYGQVEKVGYSLKYNSATCLFDCYLVIEKGHAKSTADRAQFNSQVSVVVPQESSVFVEESYMPLKNNQSRSSNEPIKWDVTSWVESPAGLENSNVYAFAPLLSPTGFYNDLNEGDEIKLFSLSISPMPKCGEGIRLFENGLDPLSTAKGMKGADFRNGFTMGGVRQKYNDNTNYVYPAKPSINRLNVLPVDGLRLEIDASPAIGECQNSLKYEFFGPRGLIGDYADLASISSKDILPGEYMLRVTDNLGCASEMKFYPKTSASNTNVAGLTASTKTKVDVLSTNREESFNGDFYSEIYPNPSYNIVNVILEGDKGTKVDMEIYDISGSILQRSFSSMTLEGGESEVRLETNLNPGMYTLVLTLNKKERVSHKLLIVK